jgi:hypothetical protein
MNCAHPEGLGAMEAEVHAGGMVGAVQLVPRPVVDSVDELLDGARRVGTFNSSDARSPAPFERVEVDGEPCVVKFVHVDHDFAMRAAGDVGCLPRRAWELGLMDVAPDLIDHATLGAAHWGRNGWGVALLMRDVSKALIPAGDTPVPEKVHVALVDHLAGLSARCWGWRDELDLLPVGRRWEFFSPQMVAGERALGFPEQVPRIADDGWRAFAARAPRDVADVVDEVRTESAGLVAALESTPTTFVHGDWKFGNLGHADDGRTVLLDWAYVGEGYACHELAWYVALNRSRLPVGHTKESTIDDFRAALERHGVATEHWFDRQLGLCLLGALAQFGWEKALGDDTELGWWCERARAGADLL